MRFATSTYALFVDPVDVVGGHTSDAEVWRVTRGGRVGASVLGICWLALAIGVTGGGGVGAGVLALLWISLAMLIVGIWRWAFVPYVALTPEGVTVQNRLTKQSVPYSAIAEVKAGFYGLTLIAKDGEGVTAWAVQKSNVARWAHKETRADEVGAAIMAKVNGP